MRRLLLGLAVALSAAGLAAGDETATAVVKKSIDAHGGADVLNKHKAGKLKMKGVVTVQGMDIEFTGTLAYMLPDRYRLEIQADVMGMKLVMNQIVKGEQIKSSIKVGDMTVPSPGGDEEKDEIRFGAIMHEAEQLTPLLDDKKFTIKSAGEEDVNGKKTAVLVITPKAMNKDVKFYFDKETWMVVKTSRKAYDFSTGAAVEVLEEAYMSDFKKVQGVPTAHKMLIHHDGKKHLTMDATDIELSEKLDDKEFTIDD